MNKQQQETLKNQAFTKDDLPLGEKITDDELISFKLFITRELEKEGAEAAEMQEVDCNIFLNDYLAGRNLLFKIHHEGKFLERLFTILKHQSEFENASLFKIIYQCRDIYPAQILNLIQDNSGRLYNLYHTHLLNTSLSRGSQIEEFHSFITNNHLWSKSPLELARFFVENVHTNRYVKFLKNYEDLLFKKVYYTLDPEWNKNVGTESQIRNLDAHHLPIIKQYENVIHPPRVIKSEDKYLVTFFIYEYTPYIITKWETIVSPEGAFGNTYEIIGRDIIFLPWKY